MSSRLITKCCNSTIHTSTRGSQPNGSKIQLHTLRRGRIYLPPSKAGSVQLSYQHNTPTIEHTSKTVSLSMERHSKLSKHLRKYHSISGSDKRRFSTLSTPLIRLDGSISTKSVSSNLQEASQCSLHGRLMSTSAPQSSIAKKPSKNSFSTLSPQISHEAHKESTTTNALAPTNWQIPRAPKTYHETQESRRHIALPLPLAIKTFKSTSGEQISTATSLAGGASAIKPQLKFPPPPAVLGSQPLYYLARKFPLLAEQELISIPNKTALDYSSFIQGAMETSYPSATTLRAALRQFNNFLRESLKDLKGSPTTSLSKRLELPRARIWTQMIRGLIWLKQYRRARVAIHVMQKIGIKPTGYAWRSICRGWIEQGQLDRAESLAAKVFTKPEISHDYRIDEKPYYITDIQGMLNGPYRPETKRMRQQSARSPNSTPLFLVIAALAECGEMERARFWFDQVPGIEISDMLTSDMVAGYLRVGQQDKAQEVIRIMAKYGVKPTAIVFNPIVQHAVTNIGMEAAEDLVTDMLQIGIFLNLFSYKILIRGYIATGQKDKALECLKRIRASGIETDRALGRILLNGFWELGTLRKGDYGAPAFCSVNRTPEMQDSIKVFDSDFQRNPGWSQSCIQSIQSGDFNQVEEALQCSLDTKASELDPEVVQVIGALADQREMPRARHWFNRLISSIETPNHHKQDDVILSDLLNRMVSGYIHVKQNDEAESVIATMWGLGVRPTVDSINSMVRWSTVHESMEDAENIVQNMVKSRIIPDRQTYEILCQGYASRGDIELLRECLQRTEDAGFRGSDSSHAINELQIDLLGQSGTLVADEVSENRISPPLQSRSVHDNLCQQWIDSNNMSRADQYVNSLQSNPNMPRHRIPYGLLIQGWISQSQQTAVSSSTLEAIDLSRQGATDSSSSSAPASSSVPTSKSLNQELRLRDDSISKMRKARSWFDRVPTAERTADLFNMMIGGYMTLGLEHESEGLIQMMASVKIIPNADTYNHILGHTVRKHSMQAAEELVRKMQKGGINPNVHTWNHLIRGYIIRGELFEALQCLDRMSGQKIITSPSQRTSRSTVSRSNVQSRTRSKTREIIERYDQEILDAVVSDGTEGTRNTEETLKKEFSKPREITGIEPNEETKQLILSGFGPDLKPLQGNGDYSRALEIYRDRVERQRQQKELLQGLVDSSNLNPQMRDSSRSVESEEDKEDEWIFNNLPILQEMAEPNLWMTDLEWKSELEWEEMMELERKREIELSGRD
ncbi:hypothetical protein BGZ76_009530 [Entomortierella beljakovae]|nr:hypothetical protein BGZ76_009530 [Entomortierella beljakovae]